MKGKVSLLLRRDPKKTPKKKLLSPQFSPPALSHRSSLSPEKAPLGAKNAAWRSRCPGAGRREAGTETKPDQSCFGFFFSPSPPLPSPSQGSPPRSFPPGRRARRPGSTATPRLPPSRRRARPRPGARRGRRKSTRRRSRARRSRGRGAAGGRGRACRRSMPRSPLPPRRRWRRFRGRDGNAQRRRKRIDIHDAAAPLAALGAQRPQPWLSETEHCDEASCSATPAW